MSPNSAGIVSILVWSVMALMMAMASRVPSFQSVGIMSLIGAVVMAIYYGAKGENLLSHFKRPVSDYLFVFSGVGLYTILILGSYHYAPAFEVTTLNYLWPILLSLFLVVFQSLPFTALKIVGMVMGIAGVVFLFIGRVEGAAFQTVNAGHYMALSAAIIWALYSCFARDKSYPAAFFIPIYLLTAFVCFIFHLMWEETIVPTGVEWLLLFLLGAFRITYALWDYAIRNGDRSLISSLAYFIPLASALFLIAGGYGATNIFIAISAVLVVAGCLIINARQIIDVLIRRRR